MGGLIIIKQTKHEADLFKGSFVKGKADEA
jgi:hypothetical protein